MRRRRPAAGVAALLVAALLAGGQAGASDDPPPIDIDSWHQELGGWLPDGPEGEARHFQLGVYPGLSAALGLPDVVSAQAHVYLSLTDSTSFSAFIGYGVEWGSPADADIVTLGWGGVRPLPAATRQLGFYGKFLRYRRWDHRDHGVHHGLSVGAESGAGNLSVTAEIGAARSDRNHWMVTAQVALKVALPIAISLGGAG